MAKLNEGFTPITLRGEERKLVCTPAAMLAVSQLKGGCRKVYESIVDRDVVVMAALLKIGLNLPDKEAKGLTVDIFESGGPVAISGPLISYLFQIECGGRVTDDVEAEVEESDEGNA